MEIIRPDRLRAGDRVYIAAPASPPDPEKLDRGVRFLRELDLIPVISPCNYLRHGYLAGHDSQRIDDLHSALKDDAIRAIFCARGGYGSPRLLSRIDYSLMREHPKILVGFSDVTALLCAFFTLSGVVTFHGPVLAGNPILPFTLAHLKKQLFGFDGSFTWPGELEPLQPPRPHSSLLSGNSFGGCLSILSTLCGTPFHSHNQDQIVFIEEVNEAPYRIDRLMNHLKQAGWFSSARAIILGSLTGCIQKPDDAEPTLEISDIIRELFNECLSPVFSYPMFGHISEMMTFPIGINITIDRKSIIQGISGVCS